MSSRISNQLAKLASAVSPYITAEDGASAWAKLKDLKNATRRVRAGRDPETGGWTYEDVPDYPIQLVATVKQLEYCFGKPVSMSLSVSANATPPENDPDKYLQDVKDDPAALKAAIETLQAIQKSIPTEIVVSPPLPKPDDGASESPSEGR